MTLPHDPGFPGAGQHPARRALHRDRPGREGQEAELVSRLAQGIAPEGARRAMVRCLDGELSPRATLAQLLLLSGSVTAVRELVDEITARTDEDSRAGDSLVRDRADELTRLFVENEGACARALARWRGAAADPGAVDADVAGMAPARGAPASGAPDETGYYERLFDGWMRAVG